MVLTRQDIKLQAVPAVPKFSASSFLNKEKYPMLFQKIMIQIKLEKANKLHKEI